MSRCLLFVVLSCVRLGVCFAVSSLVVFCRSLFAGGCLILCDVPGCWCVLVVVVVCCLVCVVCCCCLVFVVCCLLCVVVC